MSKRIFSSFLCFALVCAGSVCVNAQTQSGAYSSFSPYSIYGVGNLHDGGSAYNKSMGGAGVALRDNRFLNITNPAAVTARDSLAFMLDMSLYSKSTSYSQNSQKGGFNVSNIQDIAISFPLFRNSAMMLGITPLSSMGYNYSSSNMDLSPEVTVETSGTAFTSYGQGGLYQVFVAAGASFFDKKLSVGAQLNQYFGDIEKYSNMTFGNSSFYPINSGSIINLSGTAGKFGIQYEQAIGKSKIAVGATYRTSASMRGFAENYTYVIGSSQTDTTYYRKDTLSAGNSFRIADELAVGVCFSSADKWKMEIDYVRSGWNDSGLDSFHGMSVEGVSNFTASASESFRVGFEFIPNRNDIRYYYKRISYRCGAYWNKDYFKVDGNNVNSYGITLGGTLPVFRWYNGLTMVLDLGRRSTSMTSGVLENYVGFSLGINMFDIWFQQPRYD